MVGGEGTETAVGVLDGLDFAAESFSHGVSGGAGLVGEQSLQVVFECAGDVFPVWSLLRQALAYH